MNTLDDKAIAVIRGNIRIYDNRVAERDVSKLLAERDRLLGELDPPVCRLQFPDGTVPANAREAAEGWKRHYDESNAIVSRVWKAIGIENYADAGGHAIDELVADLKRRAHLWERLHDKRTDKLKGIPHGDPSGEDDVGSDDPEGKLTPGFEGEIPNRRNFGDELVCLLNKYSKENGSNTPDFILAEYLIRCLESSDMLIRGREDWYGMEFYPGGLGGVACEPNNEVQGCKTTTTLDERSGT